MLHGVAYSYSWSIYFFSEISTLTHFRIFQKQGNGQAGSGGQSPHREIVAENVVIGDAQLSNFITQSPYFSVPFVKPISAHFFSALSRGEFEGLCSGCF